jgi:nucleoside-diphosphate-sugar epimerase
MPIPASGAKQTVIGTAGWQNGAVARPQKILILGCGYLGRALGIALAARGDAVTGWVRSAASAAALPSDGITPWRGDLADPAAWDGLPRGFNAVVHCAASGGGGPEAYRSVYLDGVREALRQLPGARLVFVSSTSVYGQTGGEDVTEESPAAPATETGRLLREAEEAALTRPGTIVLRVAGIYGPGRGALLRRFRAGEAVIEDDGQRRINQAHRDDIVAALLRAVDPIAPLPGGIYNVSEDEAPTYLTYYGWLAERLGLPLPPFGPINPQRKRGLTNKRVMNAKLKAAGWFPRYPTFREGLDAELKNL